METKVNLCSIYAPSEDVVAREVQGEFIIIPITSGIADLEDEIFSLNETGRAIWDKLDGKKSLRNVIDETMKELKLKRLQVAVRTDFEKGKKFVEFLDFEFEGVMHSYFPDGSNAFLYARFI